MLAIERSREDIVDMLIQHGAKPTKDRYDNSTLRQASTVGNPGIVKSVIGISTNLHDGSLQEAAKTLNHEVAKMLLEGGCNPNYPSLAHEGRTAMAELCAHVSPGASEDDITQMIHLLLRWNADVQTKSLNKPILFLALDNSYNAAKALLDAVMWNHLNHDFNVYCHDKISYSPDMYVTKGLARSPKGHHPDILRLLQQLNCESKFYAHSGDQPPDYIGAPQYLIDEENRRRADRNIQQRAENAHQNTLRQAQELHEQQLRHQRDVSGQAETTRQRDHRLGLDRDRERADIHRNIEANKVAQRRQIEDADRQRVLEFDNRQATQRLGHTQRERQLQLDFTTREYMAKQNAEETIARTQGQIIRDQEAAQIREHQRLQVREESQRKTIETSKSAQLSILERQKEVKKLEATAKQRQIEYRVDDSPD